jgi:hypothetical protein
MNPGDLPAGNVSRNIFAFLIWERHAAAFLGHPKPKCGCTIRRSAEPARWRRVAREPYVCAMNPVADIDRPPPLRS